MGLREVKKEQTRQLITNTARRLFIDRGFDHVTVAEIARTAQVSVATVFNYFPTKEDLFYSDLEAFGARLVNAVASRGAGQSALDAVRDFLLDTDGLLHKVEAGDAEALEQLRTVNRMIADSPTLLAREQQAITRNTNSLAILLAGETNAPAGDVTAHVAAHALMGVQRTMLDYARHRILTNPRPAQLAADVRDLGRQAFALLEHGLSDYARKHR